MTGRKEGKNMTWREHIEKKRKTYIGRKVKYEDKIYTVVDVDYNGVIHIDKHAEFTPTTAIGLPHELNFID